MLIINFKQVYETNEFGDKEWVLILYDISFNHYVGVPVYAIDGDNLVYLESIKRYVNVSKIRDYSRAKMIRCIYEKRKPIRVSNADYNKLMLLCKNHLSFYLDSELKNDVAGVTYLKWCRDKYILNTGNIESNKLKQNAIYWINMGYNVGSELRKLRPAILWRSTSDKNLWTMIPLTTKRKSDKYYFHYDLECLTEGTAKIENMINLSSKRIIAPYFSKDKLAIITNRDYNEIKKIISKYYLFK